MRRFSRRDFMITSAGAAAVLGAQRSVPAAVASRNASQIRIGLSLYSLRELLSTRVLNVLDYPSFAREQFGITDIDVSEGGMPADQQNDPAWLRQLKQRADDAGCDIFLWMTKPVDCRMMKQQERQAEIVRLRIPIDNAAVLGCRYVRIFVKAPDIARADSVAACVETLSPISDYASRHGLTLAIEPGASEWTRSGEFLADLMKRMQHDACRLMPDFGKLRGDIYAGTQAMMPYTAVVSAKSHDFDAAGNEEQFDYERLMRIIRSAGFKGIIAIEYEGTKISPVAGVMATSKLIERYL